MVVNSKLCLSKLSLFLFHVFQVCISHHLSQVTDIINTDQFRVAAFFATPDLRFTYTRYSYIKWNQFKTFRLHFTILRLRSMSIWNGQIILWKIIFSIDVRDECFHILIRNLFLEWNLIKVGNQNIKDCETWMTCDFLVWIRVWGD